MPKVTNRVNAFLPHQDKQKTLNAETPVRALYKLGAYAGAGNQYTKFLPVRSWRVSAVRKNP